MRIGFGAECDPLASTWPPVLLDVRRSSVTWATGTLRCTTFTTTFAFAAVLMMNAFVNISPSSLLGIVPARRRIKFTHTLRYFFDASFQMTDASFQILTNQLFYRTYR